MRIVVNTKIEEERIHDMAPAAEMMTAAAAAAPSTAGSKVQAAGRMSSIEWEPKTLTLDQMKYAREAALYVVSTKTEEEAIRIFTEGLKPVQMAATAGFRKSSSMDSSSDDDVDLGSSDGAKGCSGGGKFAGGRRGHRRRCGAAVDRDIATAPF